MDSETTISLGDLISLFYEQFLALYGDEDIASVAAAATINDMLKSSLTSCDDEASAPAA